MKARCSCFQVAIRVGLGLGLFAGPIQADPQFTAIQLLTNKEIALTLAATTGSVYRIDAATNLPAWTPLVSVTGAVVSLQHTDSASPYLSSRFYRAEQLGSTNILLGDYLSTTNGDVIIQPRFHATFVMSWNGKMIYNDPDDGISYAGLPKADLILLSHTHADHFNTATIDAVRGAGATIIASQSVYNSLTAAQKTLATVLAYGASTNVMELNVQAVPAYNSYHPFNDGNGYVLTIGGRRIYISGDTGDAPEVRAITNIDVAFVCMNQPYTMTVTQATNAVRAIRPKVVYPCHYKDSSNATTNAAFFKTQLGTDLGIEVRLRKWY